MKQIEVKIYIHGKRRPLATAIFSSEQQLDDFIDELNGPSDVVRLVQIVFQKKEFRYATIREL